MSVDKCDHCGENIVVRYNETIEGVDKNFCCLGCKSVYKILQKNQLQDYYQLRQDETHSISLKNKKEAKFKYLDDPEFNQSFVAENNGQKEISFYVEGVHCAACLWILEKLPEIESSILSANLNMSTSTLTIKFALNGKLSEIANLISDLGYYPHPILENQDVRNLKSKENRKDITRIAVSFFCTGNIMLFAFSNYLGADQSMRVFFDLLSGVLFLPILFYGAIPFYKNSFGALKSRQLSIDLPIVLAIFLGAALSYLSLITSLDHIYFDTLTTLVFLILLSRFLLKVSQQKSLNQENIYSFFSNIPTKKIVDGEEIDVFTRFLKVDDEIVVYPGETIPLDGVVLAGSSSTNNSLITGEIKAVKVSPESEVFSGCINNEEKLKIKVTKSISDSQLGLILKEVEEGWQQKTNLMKLTDKVTKYFVFSQLIISVLVFVFFLFTNNFEVAYLRALTLIIITCPCALGLTPPLTITLGLSKLAKNGILVKDEKVLENIQLAKNIFFDKTGTLTEGNFQIVKWDSYFNQEKEEELIFNLESYSSHPIAHSIREYIAQKWSEKRSELPKLEFKEAKELPGIGLEGSLNNELFTIKPIDNETEQTSFELRQNNELLARIYLEDHPQKEAKEVLERLRANYKLHMISGDNPGVVNRVGDLLGFSKEQVYSQVKPKQKQEIIAAHPDSIMVGDGANDAIAINSALVGVAVANSMDLSLRASHVFFNNPNSLVSLEKLIIVAGETVRIIKRNVSFSLIYNMIGIILAVMGLITPLLAAILMPISSFTVLASSLISTKKMRNNV